MVCSFNSDNRDFKTRLRTNGKNPDHAQKWLEDFQMHSKCTMRVERTYPHSGAKNVFKIDLRCQHNTRPRSEKVREKDSCKNTDCPAKMGITIKRVVTERKSRSKDPHLPDYPTVIQINFCHNHDILTPEILKHRSVLPEVKEKILTLFKLGHNPSTALDMHKYDLLVEYGENFEKVYHDRALLPDSQFCYRLYYKILKKESFPAMIENTQSESSSPEKKSLVPLSNCENSSILKSNEVDRKSKKKRKLENPVFDKKEMLKQISSEMCKFCKAGGVAGMLQVEENDFVMALCTPLMLRVHSFLKYSGELVFVDTYGELEEANNCRIYMFVTYSYIGALPLGCIVTTSTASTCIKSALDLWKQILPSGRFFNKSEGPRFFYTSDDKAEQEALKSCFPKAHLLICISHILQASWTFLLDRKNTIKKEHRSLLFSKIKMLLFSQTVEELEMNYAYAVGDNLVKSYVPFLDYVNDIYNHRHDWSLVYCHHLLPQADDLSIFWESAMIILKDPILSRARTYNPLQILDVLSRLDIYYERKLIDLANNRFESVRLSRFLLTDLPREAYTITQYSEIEYEVHNDIKDTAYQVDVSLGVCECRTGKMAAPCKHQLLVVRNFSVPVYDCVPASTTSEKNLLFLLATGYSVVADSSNSASKTTSTTVQELTHKSLLMPSEVVIHDLDSCNANSFFLDDGGTNMDIGNPSVLNQLPSNSLVQSTAEMLSPNSLLSSLPQQVLIPSELNPPISQNLGADNAFDSLSETDVSEIIHRICTKLKEKTSKSQTTFKPALCTFFKNLERITSDSSLEHALYSFGKFSKSTRPLFKRKVVDNKLVGLQSTEGEFKKKKTLIKMLKNSQMKSDV